jgi:hypothetical protein
MIADPQIETLGEFGLFMLAPVALAVMVGKLVRWRDRRLLQQVGEPQRSPILRTGPLGPPFGRVEEIGNIDCAGRQGSFEAKVVT